MDLASLRTAFQVATGRYDLAAAGIDQYLNAGQRLLDSVVSGPHEQARNFQIIKPGAIGVTFTAACRVIQEVWLADPTNGRTRLEKVDTAGLRALYSTLPDQMTPGRPLYYMPAVLRASPDQPTVADLQGYVGFMDVLVGSSYAYNGVIFFPPADQAYQVEVWGKFFTPDLSDTTPNTFWSTNHSRLLLLAARREMEADMRNTEGMKDFDNAMAPYLASIEKDVAEQEAMDIREMQG